MNPCLTNHSVYSTSTITDTSSERSDTALVEEKRDLEAIQTNVRKPWRERNRCTRCLCCVCFPAWARYLCWGFITALVVVIIVIGSILATFKMPTVAFSGVSMEHTNVSMNLKAGNITANIGLNVNITNPNIFGIKLSNIDANAYYPKIAQPVGTGKLSSYNVPKNSNTTIVFPFLVDFSTSNFNDMYMLDDAADRCGLTGDKVQNLEISYTIKLAGTVFFFTLHPTISSSLSFPCSPDDISKILGNYGGLDQLVNSFT